MRTVSTPEPSGPSTGPTRLTRRRFLAATGVAGVGALGLAATQVPWADVFASMGDADPAAGILVVVTLYGGNDGLGTVIPASDPAYQDARPELAYRPGEVLDVGEGLGFNPALRGLKALFDEGHLAVVRGVGYPEPDHSHFRSMAIWQTASPSSPSGAGWLGRWLDAGPDDPLRALSMETVLPPFLVGERRAASTLAPGGLDLPGGPLGRAVAGFAAPDPSDDPWRARAAASVGHLQQLQATTALTLQRSTAGGGSELARQLELVAGLVEARVPTRVFSASLGGFDTHAGERGTQERLLGQVDAALSGFTRRMAASEPGRKVVVLVYSEFGRRVRANASDGTDHGTAGPVFVLGDPVRGGLHGEQPSLTHLDAGDLKATVDFRDVYAALAEDVLNADGGQVIPGHTGRLGGLLVRGLL